MTNTPSDVADVDADDLDIPPELDRRTTSKRVPQPEAASAYLLAVAGPRTRAEFVTEISDEWCQTAKSIIRVGLLLNEAKAMLAHGEFEAMINRELPFGPRKAQKLMVIARNQQLVKPSNLTLLPPHWTTLYDLANRPEDRLGALFAKGLIKPDMTKAPPDNDAYVAKMERGVDAKKRQEAGAGLKAPKLPRRSLYEKPAAAELGRQLCDIAAKLSANLKLSPPIDETVTSTLTSKQRQVVAEMIKDILAWFEHAHHELCRTPAAKDAAPNAANTRKETR
jgi:hypothetical protein